MTMRKAPAAISLLIPLTLTAAGCNYTKIPTPADLPIVYKIDVQQGNVVTQDMLAKLQPGMDKSKVRFIMGTPLVVDVFHQNRWDYLYTLQERGGEVKQRRVSLFFKDDKLDHVDGDVKPASGEIAVQERRSDTVNVPEQEKTLLARMKDKMGGKDKKEEAVAATETKTPAAGGPGAVAEAAAGESASKPAAATAAATGPDNGVPAPANPAAPEAKTQTAAADKPAAPKTTEVTIPEDAPRPPEKSFFRKLLEKVGVGDNEGGSYEPSPSDPRYKDPTNPDTSPTGAH